MAGSGGRRGPGSSNYAWEGLRVVDKDGREVGRVEFVKLGDPSGRRPPGSRAALVSWLAEATRIDHPDLPSRIADRMLQLGFVKVDGARTIGCALYVPADEIASVIDGTVRLAVSLGDLAPQSADLVGPTA